MKHKNSKLKQLICGFAVGLTNGMFGAGGGAIMVPLLEGSGHSTKEAHAGAIGVILPVTLFSVALYMWQGSVTFADGMPFLPGTLLGAVLGAFFLKKIKSRWLKGLFGAFMIFAGIKMVMA